MHTAAAFLGVFVSTPGVYIASGMVELNGVNW
jgi:hypothetical protein